MAPPPSAAERLRRSLCLQQPTARSPVRYLPGLRVPQATRGWNQTTGFPALAQSGCPGRPVLPRPVPGRRLPLAGRTRAGTWSYRTSMSAHPRASAASHLLGRARAARDQACDVSPDGHLDVALMVTLIPRSPWQPAGPSGRMRHQGWIPRRWKSSGVSCAPRTLPTPSATTAGMTARRAVLPGSGWPEYPGPCGPGVLVPG